MPQDDISRLKIDKATESIRKPGKRKKMYLYGAAAVFVLFLVLFFTGVFRSTVTVEVALVSNIYPSQGFTVLNASGYVVPQRKAAVASKTMARLVALNVEEGSRVKKGQIVARLESDDVMAQRQQAAANLGVAKASLDQARAELVDARGAYQREKNLLAKEFTTKAAYDAAEARYRKAVAGVMSAESGLKASTAGLRNADVNVEYTQIRAPFDGVVLTKNADIGDIVSPMSGAANAKAAVVTIADMDSLQVEVDVSESSIKLVRVGQPCEIQLDALPNTRLRGAIHMIVPTADRSKATVMVKARFVDKDERVLPEMSAKVAFLSREVSKDEQKPRTAVNPKTIREKNGKKYLFLIKDGKAIETAITTGERLGDFVEVTGGGVRAGDRVIASPPKSMSHGQAVKVAETK